MTRFSSILYVSLLSFFISVLFILIYLFKQDSNSTNHIDVPVTFTRPPIKTSKFLNRKSDMEKQLEALRKHKEKSKNDDENEERHRTQLETTMMNETNSLLAKQQYTNVAAKNEKQDDDGDDDGKKFQQHSITLQSILLPWRNSEDTCCRTLREASRSILGVPSEIMNLLPTLFSYFREKDHKTILEIGSRLGYSTNTLLDAMSYDPSTKRFATVDLEIRQPIKALYRCEKICAENSEMKRREFFTREGDDLHMEIPFVVVDSTNQSEAERPIDVLFIDTLHHGAQLQMELERYPQHVSKYMLFHDTHSFAHGNEASPKTFKPFGWPHGRSFPKGLQPVLRQFLVEHADEWEEEINNVVNNGLLVVKRRTIAEARNKSVRATDIWNSATHIFVSTFPDAKEFQLEPPTTIRSLLTERRVGAQQMQFPAQGYCERAFYSMYQKLEFVREKISPPCNVATVFSRRTFAESTYLALLRLNDDELPMRISLGLILSHVAAAVSVVSSKRQGDGVAFIWSCEFSAIIAAVHGVAQTHLLPSLKILPMTFSSTADPKNADFLLECPDMKHEINSYISTYDLVKRTKFPKRPRSVHILIISGNNLKALMKAKTLRSDILKSLAGTVQHRIVVFGTWLISPKKMAEFHEILVSSELNFDLKVRFNTHTGFAMWERRDSYELSYVPEAKRKRNNMKET